MNSFVDFCAIALGLVFEWSGVMKVVSRDGWQVAGTPFSTGNGQFDALVRSFLPWVEIVIGLLLIVQILTVAAAVVAAALLVIFTARITAVLAGGQRPPCLCFGSSRPRPISWKSVARNLVLLAFAVTTIVGA